MPALEAELEALEALEAALEAALAGLKLAEPTLEAGVAEPLTVKAGTSTNGERLPLISSVATW